MDDFDDHLESVITNALSNVCNDAEKYFDLLKDTIPYFQNVLLNHKAEYFLEMSDAVMGLDLVMQAGGSEAVKIFISYEYIDRLLEKTICINSDNLNELKDHYHTYQEQDEGIIHLLYPSINMLQRVLLNALDDRH